MSHHLIHRTFLRCPDCGGGQWTRFDARLMRCRACSRLADLTKLEANPAAPAQRKRRRTAGSGVIAGRIEIGRGSVWGAGLV